MEMNMRWTKYMHCWDDSVGIFTMLVEENICSG